MNGSRVEQKGRSLCRCWLQQRQCRRITRHRWHRRLRRRRRSSSSSGGGGGSSLLLLLPLQQLLLLLVFLLLLGLSLSLSLSLSLLPRLSARMRQGRTLRRIRLKCQNSKAVSSRSMRGVLKNLGLNKQ